MSCSKEWHFKCLWSKRYILLILLNSRHSHPPKWAPFSLNWFQSSFLFLFLITHVYFLSFWLKISPFSDMPLISCKLFREIYWHSRSQSHMPTAPTSLDTGRCRFSGLCQTLAPKFPSPGCWQLASSAFLVTLVSRHSGQLGFSS